MKTLNELSSNVLSLIRSNFYHQQQDSGEQYQQFNKWLKMELFTKAGKKRFPNYFVTCLNVVYMQFSEYMRDTNCIYCYNVNGVLYTTFKSGVKNKYSFKGETSIKNYRVDPDIELVILNGDYTESGFYFADTGKTFYAIGRK